MSSREMIPVQTNEVLTSEVADNFPLLTMRDLVWSSEEAEMEARKRKNESAQMPVKKKATLKWRPQDCAQAIGTPFKFTGEGDNKKCHYRTFKFHSNQYQLHDWVLLVPENAYEKPYVAIIKDIYKQENEEEGYVRLEVQWLYRPGDVQKAHLGNWESKDPREMFYSFHRDVVYAESVKLNCSVYFVPENKQIPKRGAFIVQRVYDHVNKKLMNFNYRGYNGEQKHDIDDLVAKTVSRVGVLPDIEKVPITEISRRKRSVPKRLSNFEAERTSPDESNSEVNLSDDESTWQRFESLASTELDRDKRLEELLEAVKEKQAGDGDFVLPDDAIQVVRALEQTLYDSFADNIQKYNYNSELFVEYLKYSPVLARRLLNGELKIDQAIKMTRHELSCGFTFAEKPEELTFKISDLPNSSTIGRQDSLED